MRPSSSMSSLNLNLKNTRSSCNTSSSIVISNNPKFNRSQSIKYNQPMITSLNFSSMAPQQRFLT